MRNVRVFMVAVIAALALAVCLPLGADADGVGMSGRASNDDISVSYTDDPEPIAFIELAKKPTAEQISLVVYSSQHALPGVLLPGEKSLAVALDEALTECTWTFLITDAKSGSTVAEIAVPIGQIEYVILSYSANGGSGSMNPTMAEKGEKVTLPENGFTAPDGKEFKAWAIDGKEYAPGDSLTLDSDVTATAVWKDKSSDSPVLWIAIGAVIAVIAVGALVFVVLKRRKVTE